MRLFNYKSSSLKNYKKYGYILSLFEGFGIFIVTFYGIFSAVILDELEGTYTGIAFTFLFDYQLYIVITAVFFILIKRVVYNYKFVKVQPIKFRSAIMEEMADDLFDGNREIRITIFKEVGLTKNILYHSIDFLKQLKKGIWELKWGRYIQVYQRVGWEIKNSRSRFFYSPNTKSECQGIAARVIQNLESIQIEYLPNINNLDLNEKDLKDVKVKKYMERTYLDDFGTLKRLNAKAIHFKADAIYGNNGRPVGVLVIDCLKGPSPFDNDKMNHFSSYLNLIGSTFGGNIYD